MRTHRSKPLGVYFIMGLLMFQAFSGLAGGTGLVADPTGELLHIPAAWLEGSPFGDYLIPGLILLTVLGILPMVMFYRVWSDLSWSWFGTLVIGAAIVIWIIVEIAVIGYRAQPPLQLIYGLVGLAILGLLFLPSVLNYYSYEKDTL